MVKNMKRVASSDQELTVEECNLLSVAYENVIGARCYRPVGKWEQLSNSDMNMVQNMKHAASSGQELTVKERNLLSITLSNSDMKMVDKMKYVASSDQELTVEERSLLSIAYKNINHFVDRAEGAVKRRRGASSDDQRLEKRLRASSPRSVRISSNSTAEELL